MTLAFFYSIPLSRQWILGTLLSSLPLLGAVGYAIWSIEKQHQRQQSLLDTSIAVNRQLVELRDEVKELERSARQYAVLRDDRMVTIFQEKYANLKSLASALVAAVKLPALQQQVRRLEQLLEVGSILPDDGEPSPDDLNRLNQTFSEAVTLMTGISSISQEALSDALAQQKQRFGQTQLWLAVLGLLVLPLSVGLQFLFAYVIAKPMNQLSLEIGKLGQSDLEVPITLTGPQELTILAARLEWLRVTLKTIEAQKTRLLRHVTHELKTPLAAIFEAGSLLDEQIPGPLNAEQLNVVGILTENAGRLQEMITQLLNFNSARIGEMQPVHKVDVQTVCNKAGGSFVSLSQSRNIRLVIADYPLEVTSEPTLLEMIVTNLLSNSLHFSPEGSEVKLRWGRSSGYWWLEVSDQGPGIPEAERDNIFNPFFQGAAKRQGSTKGTGLGLAIVLECVKQLHGEITVQDNLPTGAKIRIQFELPKPSSGLEALGYS